jgi:flagellar M-ring protein FliF
MVVMGLLGLVVLLMVVRPLVRRVLAPEAQAALPASGQLADALGAIENIKAEPSETARKIDIAQIQGQVHAQSVQKVGELADRNPSEAVSIIRQWMSESLENDERRGKKLCRHPARPRRCDVHARQPPRAYRQAPSHRA